jgi:hypothetical protein
MEFSKRLWKIGKGRLIAGVCVAALAVSGSLWFESEVRSSEGLLVPIPEFTAPFVQTLLIATRFWGYSHPCIVLGNNVYGGGVSLVAKNINGSTTLSVIEGSIIYCHHK